MDLDGSISRPALGAKIILIHDRTILFFLFSSLEMPGAIPMDDWL